MSFSQTYTYADIGLVPINMSTITSRKKSANEIDTSQELFGVKYSMPIILAPMATVVGHQMMQALQHVNGAAVLPRTNNFEEEYFLAKSLLSEGYDVNRLIVSIPATNGPVEMLERYRDLGINRFCIDVANGHSHLVINLLRTLNDKPYRKEIYLMTGNVASVDGYVELSEAGSDAVRVGIGGGSVCSTSVATGVGVGQATLVRDIAIAKVEYDCKALIIADGGIKNAGDVSKAIALGADLVMSGGMFAGLWETPGKAKDGYKVFAGQASMHIKTQNEFVEGAVTKVPMKGKLAETWQALEDGLRSSMSYMNSHSLIEHRDIADEYFCLLSYSSQVERNVHIHK